MEDLLNSFVNRERDLEKVFADEHFAQAILDVFDGKESKEILKRFVDYEYIVEKAEDSQCGVNEDYSTFLDYYEKNNMLDIISYFGIWEGHRLLFKRFLDDVKLFIKAYCNNKYSFYDPDLYEKLFEYYKIDPQKWREENNLAFSDVYQMFHGKTDSINEFCRLTGIKTKDSWKKGLPYCCEYCSESFRNEHALSLHLKESHPKVQTMI